MLSFCFENLQIVSVQQFSTVFNSFRLTLSTKPCFCHKKELNAIIFYNQMMKMHDFFINVDISQRLQAISLPFTDCALNEATMNACKFFVFLFTPRLERWRRGR